MEKRIDNPNERSPYQLRSAPRGEVGSNGPHPSYNLNDQHTMHNPQIVDSMQPPQVVGSIRAPTPRYAGSSSSSIPLIFPPYSTPSGQIPPRLQRLSGTETLYNWDHNNMDTQGRWENFSLGSILHGHTPTPSTLPTTFPNSQPYIGYSPHQTGAIPRIRQGGLNHDNRVSVIETPVNHTFSVPQRFLRTSEMERHISNVRDRFANDRVRAESSFVVSNNQSMVSGSAAISRSVVGCHSNTLPLSFSGNVYSPPNFHPTSEFARSLLNPENRERSAINDGEVMEGLGFDTSHSNRAEESFEASSVDEVTFVNSFSKLPDHIQPSLARDCLDATSMAYPPTILNSTGTISVNGPIVRDGSNFDSSSSEIHSHHSGAIYSESLAVSVANSLQTSLPLSPVSVCSNINSVHSSYPDSASGGTLITVDVLSE